MLTQNQNLKSDILKDKVYWFELSNCCGASMLKVSGDGSGLCLDCKQYSNGIEYTKQDIDDIRITSFGVIGEWFAGEISDITDQVIISGLGAVLYENKFDWLETILLEDYSAIDCGQIDVEIADVIVQLGLLGEVVYG